MAERIEANGATLAYEDTGGEGPVALFVHGLGGSANAWLAQLRACEERGWRGVVYDQRGAGRSQKPPGPYSVETWSEDLVALLDALGVGEAALVGHSVGCMVAERAALELGGRARVLALCGGTLDWGPAADPVFAERVRLARAGRMDEIAEGVANGALSERCRAQDPRLLGLMREMIAANDPAANADYAAATAAAAMARPGDVACPVLAFCGSEDPVTPPAAAEAIAAAVPDGRTALVHGSAHWCQIEDPEATNAVLFGFLENLG
ncbi:MAG: alpha/beta fold hydrolase [Solirubrobacterales bacterium]